MSKLRPDSRSIKEVVTVKKVKPRGYWQNIENCKIEISKHTTLKSFRLANNKGYFTILRNGWAELLEPLQRKSKEISYEYCLLVSLSCSYPFEVVNLDSSVYYKVKRNSWENEMWSHFKKPENKRLIWTIEMCKEAALQCQSRSEFENRFPAAYDRALRHYGIIDEICAHMEPKGNRAARYIYAIEFVDNSVYVGLTYHLKTRLRQHFISTSSNKLIENRKRKNTPFEIINFPELLPVEEAQAAEKTLIEKYRNKGWTILNIAKTGKGSGAVGIGIKKLTSEYIKKLAFECKSAKEFRTKYPSAYAAASKLKILDEVQSHFTLKKGKPKNYWNNKDNCVNEAKKYKNRSELKLKNGTAYRKIIENGWSADSFSHMQYQKNWRFRKIARTQSVNSNHRII